METYGVNFDGFEPSCGWAMYKHTEEELIPNLKAEVERWRARRDGAANERVALKGLKSYVEGLSKSRDGLVGKLKAKISGSETTINEVMPLGVQEEEIKTSSSWQDLAAWLDAAKSPIGQIGLFYKHAYERANFNLGFFENLVESTELDIRFWERTLELQRAYWVFEKAKHKYKTKICRELVKTLADYIGDCREQLGRYDRDEDKKSALYEDIALNGCLTRRRKISPIIVRSRPISRRSVSKRRSNIRRAMCEAQQVPRNESQILVEPWSVSIQVAKNKAIFGAIAGDRVVLNALIRNDDFSAHLIEY